VLNRDLEKRIINGQNAAPGQFPWAGLLIAGGRLCSCSLVRADWVLTAGHCVDHTQSGSVWFGDPHRGGGGEVHRNFVQVILHPSYNGGGSDDIAMLRLQSPYQMSGTIQTIALPDRELKIVEIQEKSLFKVNFFLSFQTKDSGSRTNGATLSATEALVADSRPVSCSSRLCAPCHVASATNNGPAKRTFSFAPSRAFLRLAKVIRAAVSSSTIMVLGVWSVLPRWCSWLTVNVLFRCRAVMCVLPGTLAGSDRLWDK
jgi:secreted trypsin-like serine protease